MNYRHGLASRAGRWNVGSGIQELATVERTNYPITLSVDDGEDGFRITAQTVHVVDPRRMLDYLQTAIASLVDALEREVEVPAAALELLPQAERDQLLVGFNATDSPFPQDKLIHELFEMQVARTPEAIAVVCEGTSLTYWDLNRRANQLAHYLRNRGIQPGDYVPILMDRSLMMIIAQLAVLKCGGAYVPLDSAVPWKRLEFLIRACKARWLLADCAPYEIVAGQCVDWIDCVAAQSFTSGRPDDDISVKV